jgi:hypothetical protein
MGKEISEGEQLKMKTYTITLKVAEDKDSDTATPEMIEDRLKDVLEIVASYICHYSSFPEEWNSYGADYELLLSATADEVSK